jgi:lysophospholipase L1-like esterase
LYSILCLLVLLILPVSVRAELPWQSDMHTRYMALGDSLTAGYGAIPATEGYVYLLYHEAVFDTIPGTLFCNAGIPGATSQDVLDHQVPQAINEFHPTVITLTVGGNDLLTLFKGADFYQVLGTFQANLTQILLQLRAGLPNAKIYINNLYDIPEIPGSMQVVPVFNQVISQVAQAFNVPVADVYSAFQGRKGLLLIERHGAAPDQVHPTNAGYRAMAQAFEDVVK